MYLYNKLNLITLFRAYQSGLEAMRYNVFARTVCRDLLSLHNPPVETGESVTSGSFLLYFGRAYGRDSS